MIEDEVTYAGFWMRFIAHIIDTLILLISIQIVQQLTGIEFISFATSEESQQYTSQYSSKGMIFIVLYYTISTGSPLQASFGKKILKMKVIKEDGSKITYARAFGRCISYLISYITLMIGFIVAGLNSEKRALHDIAAGTKVIYVD